MKKSCEFENIFDGDRIVGVADAVHLTLLPSIRARE